VASLARHGFKRVVLLNGHGGNDNGSRVITDELGPKLGVTILQLTYWNAAGSAVAMILEHQGELLHACEAETSMMMALRPELVAQDRIPMAGVEKVPDITSRVSDGVYRWRSLESLSSTGVLGIPSAASVEKGERLLDSISHKVAEIICTEKFWAAP
jgi:creatinine amidohydrolase